MQETAFRERFSEMLNALMRRLDYSVVACAIRKGEHPSRYGVAALDPYLLSLDVLVERFCFEIGDVAGGGVIVAERREPTLDRQLRVWWCRPSGGTCWASRRRRIGASWSRSCGVGRRGAAKVTA
jgi:hypothetical protein